jgi:hypothetical protein
VRSFAPKVRGDTAKKLMDLTWDFPVFASERPDEIEGTYAKQRRVALPKSEALRFLAGDDPRPLVVVRECGWCEGSDDALLSTRLDNEKTVLMSHWFHMVKLPNHVLEPDHPFRNLFDGGEPPHLFVSSSDGSVQLPLSGQQSQTELWNALDEVLDASYEKDAERAVQQTYKLLDQLDELDLADARLHAKFSDELERKGPKSSKLKRIKKDIAELKSERKDAVGELAEVRDLGIASAD